MQLMQLCTYSGQLQVSLWFCGRRALCLRHKCGCRKTRTGHKQEQETAREQHDMHFHRLNTTWIVVAEVNTWRWEFWLMRKPFKWFLWLIPLENPKGSLRQNYGIREEFGASQRQQKEMRKKWHLYIFCHMTCLLQWQVKWIQCRVSIPTSYSN